MASNERSARLTRNWWAGWPRVMSRPARPSVAISPEPEPRLDQGREGLDVRAHHHDVARFQGGVVLEQPDQDFTEYVDLSARAVAGMHLDRAVARVEPSRAQRSRGPDARWPAGRPGASPTSVDGVEAVGASDRMVHVDDRTDRALQFASVSAEGSQQWVRDQRCRWCPRLAGSARAAVSSAPGPSTDPATPGAARGGRHGPAARASSNAASLTGMRVWPKSDRRAGRSRLGSSSRSRASVAAARTSGEGSSIASTSRRHNCGCHNRSSSSARSTPSRLVTGAPGGRADSAAARRTTRRGWPVGGPRCSAGPVEPRPTSADIAMAQVASQRRTPGLVQVVVDDAQQRPDQAFGSPRIVRLAIEQAARSTTPATGSRLPHTPHPRRAGRPPVDGTAAGSASAPRLEPERPPPPARKGRPAGAPTSRRDPRRGVRCWPRDGGGVPQSNPRAARRRLLAQLTSSLLRNKQREAQCETRGGSGS